MKIILRLMLENRVLVKLDGYIINTRNVAVIEEIEDGIVKVYFNDGYADFVKLKIKMDDLVNILGVVENG